MDDTANEGVRRDRRHAKWRIIGDMPKLRTERSMPLNFGGRSAELSMLRDRLDEIVETGSAMGGIALITGVPGSGKTTLAMTFAKRSANAPGVAMLEGGVSQFGNHLHFFLAIGKNKGFREIANVDPQLKSVGAGGVAVAQGKVDLEHVRTTLEFETLLRASADAGLWKGKALVVVVDELQQLKKRHSDVLTDLHKGLHRCPILVVGAGLQNTPDVLVRRGVSRVVRGVELGPLERAATRDIISETLIDLDREAPTNVVNALAEASHDFPQHIHCYLEATVDAVKASVGWRAPCMLKQVLEKGDELRTAYYDSRLRAMGEGRPRMLPLIERMENTGSVRMSQRAAAKAITDAGDDDGKAAVADAIQHGVLTLENDEFVSFGIPSFHGHMVGVLRQHRDQLRREQQLNDRGIDR